MLQSNIKKSVAKGIAWQGLERVGSYGINFIVSVVLARLLSPDEFGTIAIMMVFINLSEVFIDFGFSSAIVQKKTIEQRDLCSVFYFNILAAVTLYFILLKSEK